MSTTYVIVDVETTGLNASKDAIIEVAAISLQGNDIIDEFSSLVNPHREVPDYITELTGISTEMVEDAPSIFSLRSRLRRLFAGNVVVGHNVDFDLGFLREENLAVGNHRIDTVTLASILVPESGRYNLEALALHLNLPLPGPGQSHRALDDAEITVELLLALQERALALETQQLEEIVAAGRRIGWPEALFFEEMLAQKARLAFKGPQAQGGQRRRPGLPRLYVPPKLNGRSPSPVDPPESLDIELISGMIQPGGHFSQVFKGFEHREQQVEMLESVAMAYNQGDHMLIEAGTGTGKSVGYLLPSAFWAYQNGRRVVISTNTINLQDQLILKDIPELQRILPFELRAAIRKGRRNYICTRVFQQMRHGGPSNGDEMILYARILLWLPQTTSGDVVEIPLRTPGERLAWSRISADNGSCTADHCAAEHCPLFIAKRQAELAHLVIVNHSLLLSDVANSNHILPGFLDLIIDEAHHLESAVTSGLSFRADKRSLETVLDEIIKPRSGMLADLQRKMQAALPPEITSQFDGVIDKMRQGAQSAKITLDEFFTTLRYFLDEKIDRRSQFATQIRLTDSERTQPDYDEVEMSWDNLNSYLRALSDAFVKLGEGVADIEDSFDMEEGNELRMALTSNGRSLNETRHQLNAIISEPEESWIYWAEALKDRLSLNAAPLHVGPLVDEHVFQSKETVILTSATMQTASFSNYGETNFTYIRDRLHAHTVGELALGSPFDYKHNTLLYLVSDMPEPNQPGYQRYVEDAIIAVATALGGRTMVLFTAYGQLMKTVKGIESRLAAEGITTLAQRQGSSRQQLLDQFKREGSRSVLLGTKSFWEGVDVPGEALQALLITKFPFDVPSDPIFAARSETFENAFFEYSIPEAVLRFRQGFGRLVRRKSDEGVVVILDKRILTKRYGQMFLESLPECTVIRQRHDRLAELTLRWFNRDRSVRR